MTIEFFKISDSRTELRCSRCHGLMGWWDEPSRTKKIMPFKRAWSEEECLAMRQDLFCFNITYIRYMDASEFA